MSLRNDRTRLDVAFRCRNMMNEELESLRTAEMCPRISTTAVRSYYASVDVRNEVIGAACIDAFSRQRYCGVLMLKTMVYDSGIPVGIAVEA